MPEPLRGDRRRARPSGRRRAGPACSPPPSTGGIKFDGTIEYEVALKADDALDLGDVRLEIPYVPAAATYMMGLGRKGGVRPPSLDWAWDVATKNQDGAWLGGVNAGMAFSLRGDHYVRPLNTNFYLQKPLAPRPRGATTARAGSRSPSGATPCSSARSPGRG